MWSAGTEDYRRLLWGSTSIRHLGLRLLPQIETDLHVGHDKFDDILRECEILENKCLAQAEGFEAEDVWWQTWCVDILVYCNNLKEAVSFAKAVGADEISVE
jgi:hypothetical protein